MRHEGLRPMVRRPARSSSRSPLPLALALPCAELDGLAERFARAAETMSPSCELKGAYRV
jgi:hypothetical protein